MTVRESASALWRDLHVLYRLTLAPAGGASGATHGERMERFYRAQAADYDGFRARLLHGRERLFSRLPFEPDGTWVDLGAGTGSNLELAGDRVEAMRAVWLVDLSPSLLAVARRRIAARGWRNVQTVEADATRFELPPGTADVVTLSYALTMIPDWFAAIDHALRLLKPGGVLGVVDFHVSRKFPREGQARHGWLTRTLWPAWFAQDDVHLSPDHLPYLLYRCRPLHLEERHGTVPYLPGLRVPYYIFIGTPRAGR